MRKTIQNLIINSLVLLVFLMFSSSSFSQTISGKWKTIDDETGEEKSIVQIWKAKDGLFYGKIMKLFDESKKDNVCDKCDEDDPRYNQKVVGMKIIMKMKKTDANEWTGGTILDPNNGKVYKCKLSRDGDKLAVRGFIGFSLIGRTQTWVPMK
ncbi:MAG: DUF2147 domain-containing protein [Bacteroidota bacterium]